MGIFSALLPVVGGLLGARSQAKSRARSDYMNSPQGIRANAEAAGFNPLVFAGPGTGTGAQYAPQMGSIISNAFASAANQWTREKELEIANQQLELERDRLQDAVQRATLQPNVGGIYEQTRTGPRAVAGQGGGDSLPDNDAGWGGDSLPELDIVNQEDYTQNEVANFTMFGRNFYGSGAFSAGGIFEEGLGESELMSTLMYPLVLGDAVGNTLRNEARQYWTPQGPRPYYYGVGPLLWPPNYPTDNPYRRTPNRDETDDNRASRGFGRSPYGSGLWTN